MNIQIKTTIEGKVKFLVDGEYVYEIPSSWARHVDMDDILKELNLSDGEYEIEFKITKQQ